MLDITVCTPTIPPRSEKLGRAVRSVENQTVKPTAHLIMVDVHKVGAPAMLDSLIQTATTEYVAILADDDELLANHLEVLSKLIMEETADIAFSHFVFGGRSDAGHLEKYRGVPFDNNNPRQMTGVFLAKRQTVLDVGGHSSNFDARNFQVDEQGHRIGEDYMLVKKLAQAGAKFAVTGETTWIYHVDGGNTLGMPDRW
jgi:hypothetical protein